MDEQPAVVVGLGKAEQVELPLTSVLQPVILRARFRC